MWCYVVVMNCPYCENPDSKVVETRENHRENVTRRRRECKGCGERYTTYERVETPSLTVIKKDGSKQRFKTEKLRSGVERSCKKRPVSEEDIDELVENIETDIRARGENTIESREIGDMVIEALKQLDEVAYVRYASIYKDYEDAASFEEEVKTLRTSTD